MDKAKSSEPYFWWYRMRVVLLAPSLYVMAFCKWYEYEHDAVLFTVGPAIMAIGVAVRVWAQLHCGYRLKAMNHRTRLVTTGPYAYVRNPMYIGNTLTLVGTCFACELPWFIPVVVLNCALVYGFAVRYEEAKLTRKYGEAYRRYMQQVPRWTPLLRRLPKRSGESAVAGFRYGMAAELHNLFYLAIPVIKELISDLPAFRS